MRRDGREMAKIYAVVFALIVLFALAPVISVIVAGVIADHAGCALDEGSIHPCIVIGRDLGETLYVLGVSGWFALVTLPVGALALVAWLVALIVHLVLRRQR